MQFMWFYVCPCRGERVSCRGRKVVNAVSMLLCASLIDAQGQ